MIEQLFAKIYGNNNEIVICNSKILTDNKEKIIIENKNYFNSEVILNKKSFSIFDIKKDIFNLFIWWPLNKIFKKDFIEDLSIEYENLKSSEDLYFVAVTVISSKNISFINKNLIFHRLNNSVLNRYKNIDNLYFALKELKRFLKEKGLYKRFKQDFINYVAKFSIWNLESINEISFCELYKKLKNKWWKELGIVKYNKKYFYDINIYKKIKNLMDIDLKKKNNNEEDYNSFNQQKNLCLSKINYNFDYLKILNFIFFKY